MNSKNRNASELFFSGLDSGSVADCVIRMGNHLFVLLDSGEDLRREPIPLADFNQTLSGLFIVTDKNSPVLSRTEKSAVGNLENILCLQITKCASSLYPSPRTRHVSGGDKISAITRTRCSSTPRLEIFVNPAGSTIRTAPESGSSPPQRLNKTGVPFFILTASEDKTSTRTSRFSALPISISGSPAMTAPSLSRKF